MGHGKLRKFAENETFRCLLQPEASEVLLPRSGEDRSLRLRPHPIQGHWGQEMFGNDHPIALELGCGKGDYTIALAERHPERNYIGVDIKGARLWKGAKYATEHQLPNVAFLRTRIEFIEAFFGPQEVAEIWLTFSDPQLGSENARLSSPLFLQRYRRFLSPEGVVHLKTDSRFLHEYTRAVLRANDLPELACGTDIYRDGIHPAGALQDPEAVCAVQTFYESMFLQMGYPITYLAFTIPGEGPFRYPDDFDAAYWREQEGPRRTFSHQPASSKV